MQHVYQQNRELLEDVVHNHVHKANYNLAHKDCVLENDTSQSGKNSQRFQSNLKFKPQGICFKHGNSKFLCLCGETSKIYFSSHDICTNFNFKTLNVKTTYLLLVHKETDIETASSESRLIPRDPVPMDILSSACN